MWYNRGMEKVLIVSQTCPRCFSLLNSIYQQDLYKKFIEQKVTIVYYNDYLRFSEEMMKAGIDFLKNVDPEKYEDIPYVTPILIEHDGFPENSNILAVGESAIFNFLENLQ